MDYKNDFYSKYKKELSQRKKHIDKRLLHHVIATFIAMFSCIVFLTNNSIVGIIITVGAFIFVFLLISKYFEIRRKKV